MKTKKMKPVTTSLRKVLKKEVGLTKEDLLGRIYSDPRKVDGRKAVGVKVRSTEIKKKHLKKIQKKMEKKGYIHHYTRFNSFEPSYRRDTGIKNKGWWSEGWRFCYSIPEVVVEPTKKKKKK